MEWKLIKVGELFDIHPTKSYKMTNRELFSTEGNTPILSNTSVNNGICGYCGLEPTEKAGIITFSDTTVGADTMFYQPNSFIGYSHVQGMYSKGNHVLTEKESLYIISAVRRASGNSWNYSNKFTRKKVADLEIKLPITTNCSINWQFMEDYITELEQERITELEQYLIATGLNDYHLTEEEKNILKKTVEYKEYKLDALFESRTGNVDLQQKDINGKGTYFVNSGEVNNGIKGKTDKEAFIFPANTITIDFFGNAYYRDYEYKMATHNHVFSLSSECIKNKEVGLYLVSAMSYLKNIYSFSNMGTWNKMKEKTILLPVNNDDEIDYEYMEKYIKAIEKTVIKDVVDWKDKVIEKTKEIVAE